MATISESEFRRLCDGIYHDREVICRNNPIGTREETLLWMLMNCLVSYMSLTEQETPCFTGRPDAAAYRDAIAFIVSGQMNGRFEIENCLDRLSKA
jgi:hypothetical protein